METNLGGDKRTPKRSIRPEAFSSYITVLTTVEIKAPYVELEINPSMFVDRKKRATVFNTNLMDIWSLKHLL
ncbi:MULTISPECIES: hypothetical protein [Clostridia]|uniref:hypothetical protein n=1 Tax=Clostridia TaxID=186801 RepID=UPI0011C22F6A|nr:MULTISPECIES: hypothetical protein [Clostridia]